MYTVGAQTLQDALSPIPKDGYSAQFSGFDPDARCSVSIEHTGEGKALLLIANTGAYRVLVSPKFSPRVLNELKRSGDYKREDTQGRINWAIARAQAASEAA